MNQTLLNNKTSIVDEILYELDKKEKYISSKFFYDRKGSMLFDEITHLNEYYVTRTEKSIMLNHLDVIAQDLNRNTLVIELGAGSRNKIKTLLEHIPSIKAYVPVDISSSYILKEAVELDSEYSELTVKVSICDYTQNFIMPNLRMEFDDILLYYPGSSIGNFHPEQAKEILKSVLKAIQREYPNTKIHLLLGVDLIKNQKVLEDAYNDAKGITGEFNLNILNHINKIANANFNLDNWIHHAFYNSEKNRIEMHLRSLIDQEVSIANKTINFQKHESICTEYSYKYSKEIIQNLFRDFLHIEEYFTDPKEYFGVFLFRLL